MSLLKLASLHTVARFCFTTDATRSLVVVFPFEPPMAVIGNPKSFRYSAASRPNALRVSATATTAQPRCEVRSARAGLPGNPAFSFLPSPFPPPPSHPPPHRHSTFSRRVVQEVVPIEVLAPQRKEQVTRLRLPRIGAHASHGRLPRAA